MAVLSNLVAMSNFRIDSVSREAYLNDEPLFLRNKEFDLLEYFFANSGRVLSRAELLEGVWDRNICCSTNTVDVHISNLRKRLKPWSLAGIIRTVHCRGYLLRAQLLT